MTSVPTTSPGPRYNPWLIRIPVLFISGGMLLVVVLFVFLTAFELRYMDKIVPGVMAMGVDLGGMTPTEAENALAGRFTYDSDTVFTLRDGDHLWQLTAGELGVSFNLDETVEQAFIAGHSGNLLNDFTAQARSWLNGHSVAPVIEYDQSKAIERLSAIAEEINRPPVDATLQINGTAVSTTPAQTGRTLDIPATLSQLEPIIMRMGNGGEIPLVINETPPVVWDVTEAARQAQTALSGPVTLVASTPDGTPLGPWEANVGQIAALLQVQLVDNGDGTRRYEVDINTAAFEAFLHDLAPGLIVPAKNGRFHFNESTRQLEIVQPAETGRELNIEETLQRLEQGIFTSGNRTVPMAFNYIQPQYHNNVTAAELGISELVAEATTSFRGSSANRRTNIAVSASKFDGVIVPPGEEFSFNRFLGDISYENGFVDGKVIFASGTATGIGGGVCQVSTTAFRAAFKGGYAIIERNSHGYRVGYYEQNGHDPGLDAAIWQPQRDFRFQNDTPYHLLIETTFDPTQSTLQFRFYSTNPGRRVEIEDAIVRDVTPPPPPLYIAKPGMRANQSVQVDYAAEGADVTVYRNIYDTSTGELIKRDHVFTHYLPWQAKFEVPPGDPRLNQNNGT